MLYNDLTVNGVVKWTGVPCLNGVDLNSFEYLDFIGSLIFIDTMGKTDPNYLGLADRYVLLYIVDGQENQQIPLQAIPSQQLAIVLNEQNCVMAFYDKDASDIGAASYVLINAPVSGIITSVFTATAYPTMAAYNWTIANGTILSGQGTSQITYEALSVGPVTLTLDATLPQGGTTQASAVTVIYDVSSFTITAPEYVWAGQFNIPVAVPYNGPYFNWSASGAVKIIGSSTNGSTIVDAGQASQPASISAVISGLTITTWNFKVVPYTSSTTLSTDAVASATVTGSLDLGWEYELVSLVANKPCWLRLYNTQADLDADAGRVIGDDPTTNIVADLIFTTPNQTINCGDIELNPRTRGINGDSPRSKLAYYSLTNTDVNDWTYNILITRTETQVNGSF